VVIGFSGIILRAVAIEESAPGTSPSAPYVSDDYVSKSLPAPFVVALRAIPVGRLIFVVMLEVVSLGMSVSAVIPRSDPHRRVCLYLYARDEGRGDQIRAWRSRLKSCRSSLFWPSGPGVV